jgi:hypothetical protein
MTEALFEPSPHLVDDSKLIGRDPRTLEPRQVLDAGIRIRLAKQAIREKCIDCCGGDWSEVRKCTAMSCSLWLFRATGSLPPKLKNVALHKAANS